MEYLIPISDAEYRCTERGSRFIGYCAPTEDEKGALEVIAQRNRRHHDATHNCWAYRIGEPRAPTERFSDAGEPSGTAGRPILQQLQRVNITQAVLIVSRWFGGTKLGKGGLVRAYGICAAETVARLRTKVEQPTVIFTVECSYDLIGLVERMVTKFEGRVEGGDYGQTVRLKVRLSLGAGDGFRRLLTEESAGGVRIIETLDVKRD